MKKLEDLEFGFLDAEMYLNPKYREFYNKIFFKTNTMESILEDSKYFLLGDKGTGKTAFSVYLSNNNYKETKAIIKNVQTSDYNKFISLMDEKKLLISSFYDVWKVILLLITIESIDDKILEHSPLKKMVMLTKFKMLIKRYHNHALSPEIDKIINIITHLSASPVKTNIGHEQKVETHDFQRNLYNLELELIQAAFEITINKNMIIFIDGLDTRPNHIDYETYKKCMDGLVNAIWYLNTNVFSKRKKRGRYLKLMLIIRPDIFNVLNISNKTNKITDNAILIRWITVFEQYRDSNIFMLTDKLLSMQQDVFLEKGNAWDYYFPSNNSSKSAFIEMLKLTYYRPRDIVRILLIIKEMVTISRNRQLLANGAIFKDNYLLSQYSQYLVGVIKDQLSFNFDEDTWNCFLEFFKHLKGNFSFNYEFYNNAYNEYLIKVDKSLIEKNYMLRTADDFLQTLFVSNILSYTEKTYKNDNFFRWCYRERNMANMNPRVVNNENTIYEIHRGLWKELNLGRSIL